MDDIVARFFGNLSDRVAGPMAVRIVIQPLMATFLAARDGIRDAKQSRAPYGWSLLAERRSREANLKGGWNSIGKVFLIALSIDVIYQLLVLRWIYLGEALTVAALLALVPYLILRGLINRLARSCFHRTGGSPKI